MNRREKEKRKEKSEKEEKKSSRFESWLDGDRDIYDGNMELRPQKEYEPSPYLLRRQENERKKMEERVNDVARNKEYRVFKRAYRVLAVVFCLSFIALLVLAVSWLPPVGQAGNPDNNEVSARYIEEGLQETGSVNIVTGMILTYRAFDTFGETNVLFIATCCVMVMLMLDEAVLKKQETDNDRKYEPKNDAILQGMAFILCPVIFIFGIYVILGGHLGPGGGFSGGAVIGAGLILYVIAFGFKKTQRFFNEAVYKTAKITSLVMYGLIGSYFYITGANGIENHIPLGLPGHILSGGIILPINICVGIEVACTMYAFYALFRRGGL